MFHVKRFVWNNRKSSDIIEPAIDVYRINLKTVARKLKLYRKIQMKTNWKEYSYGKQLQIRRAAWENPRQRLIYPPALVPWARRF